MNYQRLATTSFIAAALAAVTIGRLSATADTSSSSGTPAPSATPVLVTIQNFAFTPKIVTIPVGGSVTFKNMDQASHTATDSKKAFDSGNLDTGKSWTYTFKTAGTYNYACTYHPMMKAEIVVGNATPAPLPTEDSGY